MNANLKIEQHSEGECITLIIKGWLDVESTQILDNHINNLEQCKKLIFDFKELEYISSSGIRSVVLAYKQQKEVDNDFEIINVNDEIIDIFRLTGIDKKINIKQ